MRRAVVLLVLLAACTTEERRHERARNAVVAWCNGPHQLYALASHLAVVPWGCVQDEYAVASR